MINFFEIAHEGMGIYPQAVVDNGVRTERTQWQEGWNAFALKEIQTVVALKKWFDTLSKEKQELIDRLASDDKIEISYREQYEESPEGVYLWVLCNDLFYWACADGEDITMEELLDLEACFKLSPKYGDALWVCRKRKMRPQSAYYKYIPKEECHLFDEAGSARTDPDGKRKGT